MNIKPCPFCGHPGKLFGNTGLYKVQCTNNNCIAEHMVGHVFDIKTEAINAWNTRYIETKERKHKAKNEYSKIQK